MQAAATGGVDDIAETYGDVGMAEMDCYELLVRIRQWDATDARRRSAIALQRSRGRTVGGVRYLLVINASTSPIGARRFGCRRRQLRRTNQSTAAASHGRPLAAASL